jgi:AcrR family transcriptional regulator
MPPPVQKPEFALPGARGRYDRTKTTAQRRAVHEARLIEAVATVVSRRGRHLATVSEIVHRAAVGRNTFYHHFRDLGDALTRLEDAALHALWTRTSRQLSRADTPTERLRAITVAWFDMLSAEPDYSRTLLQTHSRLAGWKLSRAGDALRELLRAALRDARHDAVLSLPPDELRLLAVTAAMESLGRNYLDSGGEPSALTATVVDIILRTFR